MAGRRKIDETLITYFNKIKKFSINTKQSIEKQYIDLWDAVVVDTPFDEACVYNDNGKVCEFIIADDNQKYFTFQYKFKDIHNSDDMGDISWNIILQDALNYIKKNKLIKKTKK